MEKNPPNTPEIVAAMDDAFYQGSYAGLFDWCKENGYKVDPRHLFFEFILPNLFYYKLTRRTKLRYWLEEDEFIWLHYESKGPTWIEKELLKMGYKRSIASICGRAAIIGLREKNPPPVLWEDEAVQILLDYYEVKGAQYCTGLIKSRPHLTNRAMRSVQSKAFKLNLKSPLHHGTREDFAKAGRVKVCYKKGQVPSNKGKKMSAATREKVKHTWFKKGQPNHNYLYDGAVRPRRDSNKVRVYLHRRISKGKWVLLHRYAYEQLVGPIPKGYICAFKDSGKRFIWHPENKRLMQAWENKKNIKRFDKIPLEQILPHLELISMADNARRNVNYKKSSITRSTLPDRIVLGYMKRELGPQFSNFAKEDMPQLIQLYRNQIRINKALREAS